MRSWTPAAVVLVLFVASLGPHAGAATQAGCEPRGTDRPGVDRALRARQDVLGNRLLASSAGPTYASVRRLLPPLLLARAARNRPLTRSGVHYVAFGQPRAPSGAGSVALHVADGSQIVADHVGGRSLTIFVGRAGRERYGSCLSRLATPTLADGWLPILRTHYTDARGVRYDQESFADRLTSYVSLTADTRGSTGDAQIRLAAARTLTFRVPARAVRTLYAAWPRNAPPREVDAAVYEAARGVVRGFWERRLARGASIVVPERRVVNAERNLLVQNLTHAWRYSVGNAYEEFSFPESVDVAQVLSEYGFHDVARSILRTSLTRKETPYPNWKMGEKLLGSAVYFRLSRDRTYVTQSTSVLRRYVAVLGRQIDASRSGLLRRERYSSDIPDDVYGLHSQTVVWQGLRAIAGVWTQTGNDALAARCNRLAARLERGLRRAVAASQRRLPDGSLFVPVRLLDGERPYGMLTDSRGGSYWNLVMPYALASGFFPQGGEQARGVWRYMRLHGSRLLGLVRAGAYALYGRNARSPVSGTDNVYGINAARFLADNDEAAQLTLSLYGALGAAMTPGTFVAGEAASVAPHVRGDFRSMYLPPNAASNAAFLATLRLSLVHETRDRTGTPRGLELGFAAPRNWLRPGGEIAVRAIPTSFGPLSYTLTAGEASVHATIDAPPARPLALRLRLPRGRRITDVMVGGRPYSRVDRATQTIDLTGRSGRIDVEVGIAPIAS